MGFQGSAFVYSVVDGELVEVRRNDKGPLKRKAFADLLSLAR